MARVCIVNASLPPAYGGAEIAAYRYAERLYRAGTGVLLVGPITDENGEQPQLPPYVYTVRLAREGTRQRRWLAGLRSRLRIIGIGLRLSRQLFALRRLYDVLHIFNSASLFNLMAVPLARALRKPVILEMSLMGSDDPLTLRTRKSDGRKKRIPRPRFKFLLYSWADAYVSKSAPLSEAFKRAGLPEGKLRQIPYAVDTDLYRPAATEQKAELRRRFGLPVDEPVVLFVGGMNPRKGVHWLIEAFRSVRSRGLESKLLIVGPADKYEGSYIRSLHDSVESWNLSGHVTFVNGLLQNVHEYMKAADILVLPSVREGLPISVLEAMASGLAVLASDIPEIAGSQIRSGENGIVVPVGDVHALAEALCNLIEHTGLRKRLGDAARQRAEREFSVQVVDPRYRDLYAKLLEGGPDKHRQQTSL